MLSRNQIAVVTGASSGIGKAIALGLAAQEATLCLVGRKLDKLQTVADKARATSPRVMCYQTDLSVDNDLQKLTIDLKRAFAHIDLLVHSAGTISMGPLETASVEDLDRQYRTNVRAPYVLTQALLPMIKSHHGQIVFINSSAAVDAKAGLGQYAASKCALRAIAGSLRDEVNADGVRVLNVFPGRTSTPMQAAVYEIEGKPYQPELLMQPEDVAAIVINALNLPRTAEVTDIFIRPLTKSY